MKSSKPAPETKHFKCDKAKEATEPIFRDNLRLKQHRDLCGSRLPFPSDLAQAPEFDLSLYVYLKGVHRSTAEPILELLRSLSCTVLVSELPIQRPRSITNIHESPAIFFRSITILGRQ